MTFQNGSASAAFDLVHVDLVCWLEEQGFIVIENSNAKDVLHVLALTTERNSEHFPARLEGSTFVLALFEGRNANDLDHEKSGLIPAGQLLWWKGKIVREFSTSGIRELVAFLRGLASPTLEAPQSSEKETSQPKETSKTEDSVMV